MFAENFDIFISLADRHLRGVRHLACQFATQIFATTKLTTAQTADTNHCVLAKSQPSAWCNRRTPVHQVLTGTILHNSGRHFPSRASARQARSRFIHAAIGRLSAARVAFPVKSTLQAAVRTSLRRFGVTSARRKSYATHQSAVQLALRDAALSSTKDARFPRALPVSTLPATRSLPIRRDRASQAIRRARH